MPLTSFTALLFSSVLVSFCFPSAFASFSFLTASFLISPAVALDLASVNFSVALVFRKSRSGLWSGCNKILYDHSLEGNSIFLISFPICIKLRLRMDFSGFGCSSTILMTYHVSKHVILRTRLLFGRFMLTGSLMMRCCVGGVRTTGSTVLRCCINFCCGDICCCETGFFGIILPSFSVYT